MSTNSKLTKTARDQKIIEALGSQLKAAQTIVLDGNVYKAKDLQQQFQTEVDAAKATLSARTAWNQAVIAEQKVASQITLLRKALRSYLIATYGATSATVAEFGFTPKSTTVTVATKAAANGKRAATVAAGGTKAKRPRKGTASTAPADSAAAPAGAAVSVPVAPAVNSITPKTATPS